jgi:glycolate oxidase FAD binding subunit
MNVQTTTPPNKRVIVDPWVEQLAQTIETSERRFLPHGARTKPGLLLAGSGSPPDVTAVDMTTYAGIVGYEASEFLITARAGTSVEELQSTLAERGQYLPCDPPFAEARSTIGGLVASGISGSSRLLYGTLRDFVMEVQFIDGLGRVVRGGGKVVKNAAGFDLPKLMVGSYGRLGIITELTFKVYPRPSGVVTLLFELRDAASALRAMQLLTVKPLPLAAADLIPAEGSSSTWKLAARFAAPIESLNSVARRAEQVLGIQSNAMLGPAGFAPATENVDEERAFWCEQARFIEACESGFLVRVAMGPNDLLRMEGLAQHHRPGWQLRYTGACSVAWIRGQTDEALDEVRQLLSELELEGVLVAAPHQLVVPAAEASPARAADWVVGRGAWRELATRIQRAMDPDGRFVSY